MNASRIVFPVLILLFVLPACKTNFIEESMMQKKTITLTGIWQLEAKSGGIGGTVFIPPPGLRSVINFASDGNYFEYINHSLIHSSRYIIKKDKTIYSSDSLDIIVFQDISLEAKVILKLGNDTLVTGDNYNDGYSTHYSKVNK